MMDAGLLTIAGAAVAIISVVVVLVAPLRKQLSEHEKAIAANDHTYYVKAVDELRLEIKALRSEMGENLRYEIRLLREEIAALREVQRKNGMGE
jgi:uncharacterized membrane protein YhiD involved in acid resistance